VPLDIRVGLSGGVSTTHRDGSLDFLDVISDETAHTGQSASGTFGTFGVIGTLVLPGVVPITVLPGTQLGFETGFLFHTGNNQSASFVNFSGNEATGQTSTSENWSVPLLATFLIPVTDFGLPAPNLSLQLKAGGMIDNRKATFSTFEFTPDLITSASVTKTQVNPAFGVGLLYTPGGPFTFGVQTIFDFQQPINFTVQSMPFPSAFYTVHTGNQLNTTVLAHVDVAITGSGIKIADNENVRPRDRTFFPWNTLVPSDIRLKHDIFALRQLENGLGLYRYRYLWSDQVYVGVMAQEVERIVPDAVVRGPDGYLRVDYGRLGLRLMTWEEWAASRGERLQEIH